MLEEDQLCWSGRTEIINAVALQRGKERGEGLCPEPNGG